MDLVRSSTLLFLTNIAGNVVSFVGILYFARELGAAALGVFFLYQALFGIISLFSNLGTRTAIEKRMSERKAPGEILSTGILLKLALLLIVVLLIMIFSDYIDQYIGIQIAGLVALTVILKEFGHLMSSVLRGELRVSESAVLPIVNKMVWVGTGILLVSVGYGIYGLVYGVLAGFLAKGLLGWYLVSTSLKAPSVVHLWSIWEYAKHTIIPALDEYIHNWTDVLIMGLFLSSAAVGAYEISWRILVPIFVLTGAITVTIFPQISAWDADDQRHQVEQIFPKALTPSLILIVPAFFGATLLSSEILGLLFGEGFEAAALALPILVAGLIPRAVREVTGKTLQGIDKPQFVNKASVIDIVVNIGFNIILIWQIGLVGAAIATSLSYTVGAALRWYYLDQYLDLHVPYREIGWCLLSSVSMFVVIFSVQQIVVIDTVVRLLSIVGFGAVVYSCTVLLYEPIRTTIARYANRILRPAV
jgi:O-antigen/teichoic acid export membrane protein